MKLDCVESKNSHLLLTIVINFELRLINFVYIWNIFRSSICQLSYIKILRNSIHSEGFSEIISSFSNF